MNWKQHIFKPDWQHRDPERRKQAVARSNEAELLKALPRIAVEDEDLGVRAAAAKRINDLEPLQQALAASEDKAYCALLDQRIEDLVCHPADGLPTIEQRRAYIEKSEQRHVLERVATEAEEPELRLLALSRTDRQGFLGDRAINDPDPEIRRTAAAAIKRHATLKRVIKETRTRDKSLHAELQRRLEDELLESGDRQQVAAEALEICKQLEAFAVLHQQDQATVPSVLAQRWQRIQAHVKPEIAGRHAKAVSRIETAVIEANSVTPAEIEADELAISEQSPPTIEPVVEMPTNPAVDPRLAELQSRIDQVAGLADEQLRADRVGALRKQLSSLDPGQRTQFEDAIAALEHRVDKLAKALDQGIEKTSALYDKYSELLEEGALHKALEIRQQMRAMANGLKHDRRWKAINSQVGKLHPRLKELRDWQHWSNNKVRKDLIKQMELLPKADLHPDALLSRVRTLQEKWKELEHSEQIPGDPHFAAAPWMWRKFQAAGNVAFEAAKPFLDKRSEIHKKREQQSREVAGKLMEIAAQEHPDWGELRSGMNEARTHLQDLDALPHKSRKKAANVLRKALSVANERVQEHYEAVEKEKRKLIRAAEQLVHVEDRKEAIEQAKRLQADWKRAGALWRGRENALWKEFRKPLDPLFEGLKQEKETQQKEFQARVEEQKGLVDEMSTLLESDDGSLEEHRGKVQGLLDHWKDIERPDRKIRARFDTQLTTFENRLRAFHGQQKERQRQRWWDKAELLQELEAALLKKVPGKKILDGLRKRWPADGDANDLDELLDQRFESALAATEPLQYQEDTQNQARSLCIRLEFLSGLASPETDREARMQYQVERLSQSMSGELERLSADDEALQAERAWLTLGVLQPEDYAQYCARIRAALKQISEINNE